MEPYPTFSAGRVRILSVPDEYLLLVQIKDGDEWKTARSFCRMSDDYAWTNAQEYATRLAHG